MFIEIEMKYLNDFPKDIYADDAKLGDEPTSLAAYGYTQLGVHPQTLKVVCYIDGDIEQFKTDFATVTENITNEDNTVTSITTVKYTELTALPTGYVQTCCNQFLYGNTLTKAAIVAWQYSRDEELALHRKQIDSGSITEYIDDYLVYTTFVDSIPDEDGYVIEGEL